MAHAPLLQLNDARVVRDGRTILRVESLVLEEGETLAVLGPNGAGKSTFVGLLTRDIQPIWADPAPVLWRGQERPLLADARRFIGIVSNAMQDVVDVHLTALEVVIGGRFGALGIPPHLRASVGAKDEAAALAALAETGATSLAQRDMTTLSTGEARRVLVARALVLDPAVLVLDEPCAGLDPTAAWHVRDLMRSLASQGRTLLLVTHDIADVVAPFQRVVLIADGEVVADGTKSEILTSERLSDLFGVALELEEREGEYRVW